MYLLYMYYTCLSTHVRYTHMTTWLYTLLHGFTPNYMRNRKEAQCPLIHFSMLQLTWVNITLDSE